MKHIKTYEGYGVDEIYSWWAGIKVSEDDEYYIIDLNFVYLQNKTFQLHKGLMNKTVLFYCQNHMKYELLEIKNLWLLGNELIFITIDGDTHSVDITKPIKISKLHIAANNYNL